MKEDIILVLQGNIYWAKFSPVLTTLHHSVWVLVWSDELTILLAWGNTWLM